jgi:hypothetical protein
MKEGFCGSGYTPLHGFRCGTMAHQLDVLLVAFDLAGTLVFAVEGAIRAIRGELDFLGLLVLAFVTAVGGGIIRDLLHGVATVPQSPVRQSTVQGPRSPIFPIPKPDVAESMLPLLTFGARVGGGADGPEVA